MMKGLQRIKFLNSKTLKIAKTQNGMLLFARHLSVDAAQSYEQLPGPKSLPMIGSVYKYLPGGGYSMKLATPTGMKMNRDYGPIVREQILPGVNLIRLFDPDDIETVFRQEGKHPNRPPIMPIKLYRERRGLVVGLSGENGEKWHKYRNLVQKEMLRPGLVSAYIPAQEQVADDFVTRMRHLRRDNNEVPNFLLELYRFGCESIGVVCFDQRVGTLELEDNKEALEFIANVSSAMEHMHKSMFLVNFMKGGYEPKPFKDFCKVADQLLQYTEKCVIAADKGSGNDDSLLCKLLNTPNLSRMEAIVMISDLFGAAVDTTANTLSFILYHLARNPGVQQKLYEEIMNTAPDGRPLNGKVMNEMSYLRAVIKESLRITPTAVPGTNRVLEKDVVLSGYHIPAGANVLFHNDVISRMPKYFEEPERFMPERWLRDSRNTTSCPIHPFASLPFGHGPRMCIGKRFAEQEILLGMIKMLQKFEVQYHYEDIGQVVRMVNMPDKPLKFTFIDRK